MHRTLTLPNSALNSLYFRLYRCASLFNWILWFCKEVIRCLISLFIGPVCSFATRFCSNSIRNISYSFRSCEFTSSIWRSSVRNRFWVISSSVCEKRGYGFRNARIKKTKNYFPHTLPPLVQFYEDRNSAAFVSAFDIPPAVFSSALNRYTIQRNAIADICTLAFPRLRFRVSVSAKLQRKFPHFD